MDTTTSARHQPAWRSTVVGIDEWCAIAIGCLGHTEELLEIHFPLERSGSSRTCVTSHDIQTAATHSDCLHCEGSTIHAAPPIDATTSPAPTSVPAFTQHDTIDDDNRQPPHDTGAPDKPMNPQPSIPGVAKLTDQLWTGGGLPGRTDAAERVIGVWRSVGIRAVIDTRAEWSDEELVAAVAPEIAYINPGVVDGGQPMRDEWFATITEFSNQQLSNGVGVLVHCHSGINRGPSAAFAVLLSVGWDPVEAIELIRTRRPIATVSYAEGAIDWWHRSSGIATDEHEAIRHRFDQWRQVDRAERFAQAQHNSS